MTLAAEIADALGRDALPEALERAVAAVRTGPEDLSARHLLIDLLILDGAYERADKQCAVAATLAPDAAIGMARLRAELRGMARRVAFFESAAVPDIPGGPSAGDAEALRLALAHRDGDRAAALAALQALEAAREPGALSVNSAPAGDLRDGDDRIPHALEAIAPGGAYLWIGIAAIAGLTMQPMTRPRHLAFRPAEIRLRDGSAGPVLLPAIYHGSGDAPRLKLGRETVWEEAASGITVGRGQRCFLAGEALFSLHEIVEVARPDGDAAATPEARRG